MLTAHALVATDAAERYAKQLLSHLGHRVTVEPIDGMPAPAGRVQLGDGVGEVVPRDDALLLTASAPDVEQFERVKDVLGRHLERFGAKRELVVEWRDGGGS
jgi:hypothetical protein